MTRSPIDRFFAIRSRKLLMDADFLLQLESNMLFPGVQANAVDPRYVSFLALLTGRTSEGSSSAESGFWSPPPPARGAMGAFYRPSPPSEPSKPLPGPLSFSLEGQWGGNPSVPMPEPVDPWSIEVDLTQVDQLRPLRISFDQTFAQKVATEQAIREATAEGQICAVFLEMQRLLVGTELKTKKGELATASRNIVARVLEAYNLGRPRASSGKPEEERADYKTLNDQGVKKLWRGKQRVAALWAAHRALSPLKFDTVPPSHLLKYLDLDEFVRLSLAYEDDRLAIAAERASAPLKALGPPDAFESLRKVVEAHVPNYEVVKKPKKSKKTKGQAR